MWRRDFRRRPGAVGGANKTAQVHRTCDRQPKPTRLVFSNPHGVDYTGNAASSNCGFQSRFCAIPADHMRATRLSSSKSEARTPAVVRYRGLRDDRHDSAVIAGVAIGSVGRFRVTGASRRRAHQIEQRVLLAVHADFGDRQRIAGGLALHPKLIPRKTPERGDTVLPRIFQRSALAKPISKTSRVSAS